MLTNILYMILLPSGLGSLSQVPRAQDPCSRVSDSAAVMNSFQRLPTLAHQCPMEGQLGCILRLECCICVSSCPCAVPMLRHFTPENQGDCEQQGAGWRPQASLTVPFATDICAVFFFPPPSIHRKVALNIFFGRGKHLRCTYVHVNGVAHMSTQNI